MVDIGGHLQNSNFHTSSKEPLSNFRSRPKQLPVTKGEKENSKQGLHSSEAVEPEEVAYTKRVQRLKSDIKTLRNQIRSTRSQPTMTFQFR